MGPDESRVIYAEPVSVAEWYAAAAAAAAHGAHAVARLLEQVGDRVLAAQGMRW